MKILGVDPGLKATGYGVIEISVKSMRHIKLLEAGTIEPNQKQDFPLRIDKVYQNLDQIIQQYHPEVMVLEKLYAHYKHPATAFILGHVRGIICLLCAHHNIKLSEHSVKRIRKALVGNGNATKQQTKATVAHALKINAERLTLDASDALALALGYAHMQRVLS